MQKELVEQELKFIPPQSNTVWSNVWASRVPEINLLDCIPPKLPLIASGLSEHALSTGILSSATVKSGELSPAG